MWHIFLKMIMIYGRLSLSGWWMHWHPVAGPIFIKKLKLVFLTNANIIGYIGKSQ